MTFHLDLHFVDLGLPFLFQISTSSSSEEIGLKIKVLMIVRKQIYLSLIISFEISILNFLFGDGKSTFSKIKRMLLIELQIEQILLLS